MVPNKPKSKVTKKQRLVSFLIFVVIGLFLSLPGAIEEYRNNKELGTMSEEDLAYEEVESTFDEDVEHNSLLTEKEYIHWFTVGYGLIENVSKKVFAAQIVLYETKGEQPEEVALQYKREVDSLIFISDNLINSPDPEVRSPELEIGSKLYEINETYKMALSNIVNIRNEKTDLLVMHDIISENFDTLVECNRKILAFK